MLSFHLDSKTHTSDLQNYTPDHFILGNQEPYNHKCRRPTFSRRDSKNSSCMFLYI